VRLEVRVQVRVGWMIVAMLAACAGDKDDATGNGDTSPIDTSDDATGDCPSPSDAPTADELTAGGQSLMCFYAPPEGYCWESRNGYTVEAAVTNGKGAVGCTDGVAVTNGVCPTDKAIGRCDGWGAEEDRVYYECNKFDAIFPDGIDKACADNGGIWTAL